ncbi:6-phosphogluconolactonase [Calothrix sp. CCY 0018]|uniref:6-phosphogluconolactonase n=1 Tax=Calothrix sp. CCY 0018 TaxID=3103864 RepID=UPI0039C6C876
MNKKVEVLADKKALVERALSLILSKVEPCIQQRGRFTIALSGGSTPKPLYEALGKQQLPWDKIHVLWGDERYVAADHADSNQLMARTAWLDKVDIPAENIHAMPTDAPNPSEAVALYEQDLQKLFDAKKGEFPAIDVILLGMGDDAHTASLFPNTEALKVTDKLVTVGNKDSSVRLTFTYPFINAAECVIFLVAGENKRPALAQVFAPEASVTTYPSRLIQPQKELWWLLDEAAGAEIKV